MGAADYGFRALIAPSFADIFFNNCFKNGLLPIVLPEHEVDRLFDEVAAFPGYRLTIDLERQVVVDARRRDEFALRGRAVPQALPARTASTTSALTLRHADEIRAFEAKRLLKQPWLATTIR